MNQIVGRTGKKGFSRYAVPLGIAIGVLALSVVLVSPSGLFAIFLGSEDALEYRARGLMDSMLSQDWDAVAGFVQDRKWAGILPVNSHKLEGYEIQDVSVAGKEGRVRVLLRYRLSVSRIPQLAEIPQETELSQKWKKGRLQWYLDVGGPPLSLYDLLTESSHPSVGDVEESE